MLCYPLTMEYTMGQTLKRLYQNDREKLSGSGVDFISYQENIDTTTSQGEMIFTVIASRAQ